MEKFNGYEIIKHELARKEKRKFVPIDIVYESVYDESIPVPCFFTDKIHLAYRCCKGQIQKGKKYIRHTAVRQCHYCENYFAKNDENMKKHSGLCSKRSHYLLF